MSLKGILERVLVGMAVFSSRRPRLVLISVALLTVLAGVVASGLSIDPQIQSLLPEERPKVKEYLEREYDFMHTEFMVAVVETPEELPLIRYRRFIRNFKKQLGTIEELDPERLNLNAELSTHIKDYLNLHGLLFMEESDLEELNKRVKAELLPTRLKAPEPYKPYLYTQIFDPLDITPLVRGLVPLSERATLDRSREFFISADPHFIFFIIGSDYPWQWDRTQRIIQQAGKIEKKVWDEVMPEIKRIHSKQIIPYLHIDWVGKHMDVLRLAEVIWKTFLGTMISSALLIGILFLFFFRRFRSLFLAFLPLVVGLIWSFAFARLSVGKLNMLSILCDPLLIGLGIDFPIYLLNQYYLRREAGKSLEEAIVDTWRETGRPVCLGALTTIAAFSALIASRLPAFRDVGYISSIGILLTLLAVLILLPALIRLTESRVPVRPMRRYPQGLIHIPLKKPVLTLLICLLVFGGLGSWMARFRFQSPYQEAYYLIRQPAEISSPVDRRFSEIMQSSLTPFRLLVEGDSWEEVLKKNEALASILKRYQTQGQISFFDSLAYWLPSPERQEHMKQILQKFNNLDAHVFAKAYDQFYSEIKNDPKISRKDKAAYKRYGQEVTGLLRGKNPTDAPLMREEGLGPVLDRYLKEDQGRLSLISYVYLPRGNYPELKKSLMNKLLKEDLFQNKMVRNLSEEEVIDEIHVILSEDLVWLGTFVLIAIVAIFFLTFRSLKIALISLIPMLVGGLAAMGAYLLFMGAFSVFNILWLPIYIGLATDDAIHIGSVLKSKGNSLSDSLRQSGSMIVLSSLTTIIAFGTNLFEDIQMLQRISVWIIVAMACELLASLFLLPALLKITGRKIS